MFHPQRAETTISTSKISQNQGLKEQSTGFSSAESSQIQSFDNFTALSSGTSVSSFSLKSVQFRIDAKNNQKSEEVDSDTLPKESFTQQDLLKAWKDYIEQVEKSGKKLQASSLRIQDPILKEGNVIFLDVPSQNIKSEIVANEYNLMQFLKNQLKNYSIALEIVVNERDFRPKTAFTPQDKYNRLLETNPILEQFRKEFNLNI
ncbi:DNA polymerase III subunit gamma/tau [Capnocytophaga canimorsus]|uniref:DNA polymerase III subunit gamma/tau n=1 Tax=Capnocytophaga canimorsus TaxID=28188 RepID=UPI00384E3022